MDLSLIAASDVRHALARLLSADSLASTSLLHLNLVAERLAALGSTATPEVREWVLADVLDRLVRASLSLQRGSSDGPDGPSADRTDQAAVVAEDFRAGSADREAWSCLYYRYLSPYPLAVQELAAIAQPGALHGRRLISRRLDRGYVLLANAVRSLERAANEGAANRGAASAAPGAPAAPPALPSARSDGPRAAEGMGEATARALLDRLLAAVRAGDRGPALPTVEVRRLLERSPRDLAEYRLGRIARWGQPRYRLDERFVALSLLLDRGEEQGFDRWPAQPRRYDDLALLLGGVEAPAVVLLGPPGSGKSTLLRHLEVDTAARALRGGDGADPVTFFIQLNRYRPAAPGGAMPSPRQWLADAWAAECPHLAPWPALLAEGRTIVLLDGLNEMPAGSEREFREWVGWWKDWLVALAGGHPGNRVVFSCRTLDYSAPLSTPRLRVPQVRIEPLADGQVRDFVMRYSPSRGEEIWAALEGTPELEALRWPYFLALLVRQVEATGELAHDRAALFTGFVREALRREVERDNPLLASEALLDKRDSRRMAQWGGAYELPEGGALVPGLSTLAYRMQAGAADGGSSQLRASYDRAVALAGGEQGAEIVQAGVAIGVLDEDLAADEVLFRHQLVQEYFAARVLARDRMPELVGARWRVDDITPGLREALDALPRGETTPALPSTGWEETTVLAAAMTEHPEIFLRALIPFNLPVAGRAASVATVRRRLSAAFVEELRLTLVRRSRDAQADLRARIAAGLALGWLGDPRFERRRGSYGDYLVPPLVAIPAGTYVIGDDSVLEVSPGVTTAAHIPRHPVDIAAFGIGQFPVTNAEYACFVAAGGYANEPWWTTSVGRDWRRGIGTQMGRRTGTRWWWDKYRSEPALLNRHAEEGYRNGREVERWQWRLAMTPLEFDAHLHEALPDRLYTEPRFWGDERLNNPCQPVVGVCWHEAMAYCSWLSAQIGRPVRLPTEVEWEAAARGYVGRTYPYGDVFDVLAANSLALQLHRSTPVGVFVEGDTPEGVSDLAGNTREWTSSIAERSDDGAAIGYPYGLDRTHEERDTGPRVTRVLRGGGWRKGARSACAFVRAQAYPDNFQVDFGFRVVVGEPLARRSRTPDR